MYSTQSFRQPQQLNGFSVIELMVALAITAFLLIGLVQIFSSVRASYDLQEGLGRLQENARFANTFMNDQLRDTGYFPLPEHENPDIDIGFNFPSILTGDVPPPLGGDTIDGGGTAKDTIEVNIFDERDCSGNLNPATSTGNPAIGHKQIVFDLDAGSNELLYTCRFGPPAIGVVNQPVIINNQAILNNVETLQFQYGEDQTGDGSVDTYVDADKWLAVGNVVAIRVGLILTSPDIGTLPADAQVINLLNTNFPASGERELRRPVVFNINLRNQTL
jgi:type II secretory pathway pseudopilin PulG